MAKETVALSRQRALTGDASLDRVQPMVSVPGQKGFRSVFTDAITKDFQARFRYVGLDSLPRILGSLPQPWFSEISEMWISGIRIPNSEFCRT